MNDDTEQNRFDVKMVESVLTEYSSMKRKVSQLQFEIEHYVGIVSEDDLIDSMAFSSVLGEGITGGRSSDRTSDIALSFSEKTARINIKHRVELERELIAVTVQMERIEFYIRLLDVRYSKILRKLYIEGLPYNEVVASENITPSTVKKYRRAGIARLVEMFNQIIE